MSVEENLEMGAYTRPDAGVRRDIEAMMERFPLLGARRRAPAGTLSGGQQQILEIAIALLPSIPGSCSSTSPRWVSIRAWWRPSSRPS
jgi:branched-chain amino acid transport system ATP-binding protein